MGNGEISVKKAIETEIAEIKDRSPELRCILLLAEGFDNLKCHKRKAEIGTLKKFMWILLGMGTLMALVLIPILVEVIPKLLE